MKGESRMRELEQYHSLLHDQDNKYHTAKGL